MSTISENTIAESAVADTSVNQGQYLFEFEVAELVVSATDNQSSGTVRSDDGATVYDHFRPAIQALQSQQASLEINEDTDVTVIHNIEDTATFSLVNADSAYEFEGLILEFQDDFPGLPVGPITVNAIGDIQYEGAQNFQPALVELSINATDDTIKSTSRITQGALEIGVADNDDGRAAYVRPEDGKEEWPWFRPALSVRLTETSELSLGALAGDSTAYLFASIGLDRLDRYAHLPILTISYNPIGALQYEGPMDYQPSIGNLEIAGTSEDVKSVQRITTGVLEIGATDNQGPGTVRIEDGKTEYPHFRPALEVERSYVTELTFGALGGDSTAYFFASAGIDRLPNYAGIPISPISFNPIATLQYEGIMDYQPSGGSLTLDVDDAIANISVIVDTATLEIGVDWNDGPGVVRDSDGKTEYPYFRPVLEVDRSNVTFKSLAATSEEYKFEFSIEYQTLTGAGIPIGPISYSSIAEEQQIAGALANFIAVADTIALEISATGVLGQGRQTYNFNTESVGLEVAADDTVVAVYPRTEITALEIAASDTIGKAFNYYDSASLGILTPTSIISISTTIEVTPLVVGASSVVEKTFNIVDSTALEIDSTQQTEVTYSQPTSTISNEIDASDTPNIIYIPYQGIKPTQSLSVSSSYRNISQSAAEYVLEFSSTTNPLVTRFADIVNTQRNNTGYDLNDSEVYITFWNQGTIQHAIRHASVSQTSVGSRSYYNYNEPRVQVSTLNSNQSLVIDTNPRAISITAATFNGVAYNLSTSGFDFDEIRYYQGDPADSDDVLLWSASIYTDIEIADTATFGFTIGVEDTVELEISDTSVENVLYNYTDYTHNLGELEIDETHVTSVLYNYTDYTHNLGELELSASSVESQTYKFEDTTNLGILSASDNEITYVFDNTPFFEMDASETQSNTLNSIETSNLEIEATATIIRAYVFDDTASLGILSASDNEITYAFDNIPFFELDASETQSNTLNSIDTSNLELEATFLLSRAYAFDDSTNLGILSAFDLERTFAFDNIPFFELDASDVIGKSLGFIATASIEIGDSATQSITRTFEDSTNLGILSAFDLERAYAIENVPFVGVAASDEVQVLYNYTDYTHNLGELEIEATTSHSVTKAFTDDSQLDIDASDIVNKGFVITDTGAVDIDAEDAVSRARVISSEAAVSLDASDVVVYARTFVTDLELEIGTSDQVSQGYVLTDETGLTIRAVGFIRRPDGDEVRQFWSNSGAALTLSSGKQIWIE